MVPAPYTLDDLVEATGFSKRQIRFYITKRLVPGAGDRGPNATYGEETMRRLRLIDILKERRVGPTGRRLTLDEIGHALEETSDPDDGDRPQNLMVCAPRTRPYGSDDPESALDYLNSLKGQLDAGDNVARFSIQDRRIPFDEFASPVSRMPLPQSEPIEFKGGEDQDDLTTLLGRLQTTLAELGSDTRFTVTAKDGAQWLRIASPDVEFHIRQPDDHRARRRLSDLALELGRLLAREE